MEEDGVGSGYLDLISIPFSAFFFFVLIIPYSSSRPGSPVAPFSDLLASTHHNHLHLLFYSTRNTLCFFTLCNTTYDSEFMNME